MLRPGDAIVTESGRLKCKAIIHVAALNCIWISNETIVRNCTRSAIAVASINGYESIAFPLIGAGTGGLEKMKVSGFIYEELSKSGYEGTAKIVFY